MGAPAIVMHAPDTDRVRARTAEAVNTRLDLQSLERIADCAATRNVDERLESLDKEWNFERVVEAEAAVTALAGLALGVTVHRGFLFIPGFAAAMMLLHAVDGRYPLLPILRRIGVRTQDEIDRERYALKAVRGDFARVRTAQSNSRAEAAWEAVRL